MGPIQAWVSARRGSGPRCGVALLSALMLVASASPSPARAAFTRPALSQITSAEGGAAFSGPGGVAVDKEDNLWLAEGEYPSVRLNEFGPAYGVAANEFKPPALSLGSQGLTFPPTSLAIERASGNLELTGERAFFPELEGAAPYPNVETYTSKGALLHRIAHFGAQTYVTVDNGAAPADPSACAPGCTTYVAHSVEDLGESFGGDELPPGIEKFDSSGVAQNFVNGKGERTQLGYVKGNEILGTPPGADSCEATSFVSSAPRAIVTDAEGNIYALTEGCGIGGHLTPAVVEFHASGEFARIFSGAETPGVAGRHSEGGFGGLLQGIAFDPTRDHLLVSVAQEGTGAIDEFDIASGKFLAQITQAAGGALLRHPSQMTVDSHGDLYAVDLEANLIDVFGPGKFAPGVRLGEATKRTRTSAVLNGTVNAESTTNPEAAGLTECFFEYVSDPVFAESGFSAATKAPCSPEAGAIPPDSNAHPVSAAVGGLESGVIYHYRLVARTGGALGESAASGELAFIAPASPRVESATATNISSTSVDLRAVIDPLSAPTSYRFEYDTRAYLGGERHGTSIPIPAASIGAGGRTGNEPQSVLEHVEGLAPATTYHFRVVAESEIGGVSDATVGQDASFVTLSSAATELPDHRGYELVTPAQKTGGSDMFAERSVNGEYRDATNSGYAADSGAGWLLETSAAFGPFPGALKSAYVFSRDSQRSEWSYRSLASPALGVQSLENTVFDPSTLARVGVNDAVGAETLKGNLTETGGGPKRALVGPPGGPYTTLHTDPPLQELPAGSKTETTIVGASRDLGHLVLESGFQTACPGSEAEDPNARVLCESDGGALKPVNVDGAGAPVSVCGAQLGATGGGTGATHNAVSGDGTKVFFTAPDPGVRLDGTSATAGCWDFESSPQVNAPQIYMRTGGTTLDISAPEAGVSDPAGPHRAEFAGASEDGAKVFFISESWLTADHPAGHDLELYEYATATGKLTRISRGEAGSPGAAGGAVVNTVPAVSADGAAVYFTASGALAPGSAPYEPIEPGGLGRVNLYRYDSTLDRTTFVATIINRDYPAGSNCGVVLCSVASWYTTPDGRYLAFATSEEVKPGYSTAGPCELPQSGGNKNGHCVEIYRYDAGVPVSQGVPGASDNPVCISCNPSGAPPRSNALFSRSASSAAMAGAVRAMSDNGAFVFFDTAEALVPQDTNGTLDVYEWHEGHLALISSGKDAAPSFFLGSSAYSTPAGRTVEGGNVFFGTHSRLISQDTDSLGDVYDARICEAEAPCIAPPPSGSAQCEGDACQSPPALPGAQRPGTLTSSSTGNIPPSRPATKTAAQIRAEKLAKALKGCHKLRSRSKRRKCEASARKRYGPARKATARRAGNNRRARR